MKAKSIISALVLSLFTTLVTIAQAPFRSGKWIKIGVKETSVYHITKSDLESWGIETSNPSGLIVLGGSGSMLEQSLENGFGSSPDTVPSVLIQTGSDFKLLFMGEAAGKTTINRFTGLVDRETNLYSDSVFYFIGQSNTPVDRITFVDQPHPTTETGWATRFYHHEEEQSNLLNSGRVWYGQTLSSSDSAASYLVPLVDFKSNLQIDYGVIGQSSKNSISSSVFLNDSLVSIVGMNSTNADYGIKARYAGDELQLSNSTVKGNNIQLGFSLDNRGNPDARLFIDYFDVLYQSNQLLSHQKSEYYWLSGQKTLRLHSSNAPTHLWAKDLDSGTQNVYQGTQLNDSVEFYLPNQNLQIVPFGLQNTARISQAKTVKSNLSLGNDPQLLIIYPQILAAEAQEFKRYKESIGIKSHTAEVSEIYNQYANGKKDITAIRNYIKEVFDRSADLKYVLLFGDCSYDYKNRIVNGSDLIPTYQSRESYHDVETYSSDDYYGFLSATDGFWDESRTGNHFLDIAVGRFPINTPSEARLVMEKIKNYELNDDGANWKNELVLVADDGDDAIHVTQADQLAYIIQNNASFMNINRIYIDSYDRKKIAHDQTKEDLKRSIEEGSLIINFTGHGTEFIWTEELILTMNTIKSLENANRLPLFVTATCEFGRYDDPLKTSGAEALLVNTNGAIGLVTTTRPVYASSNSLINKAFYQQLFIKKEGKLRSLGEVLIDTKNTSLDDVNNRNFTLLGDPSLYLKLPSAEVEVLTINDSSAATYSDTLNPGEMFTLRAEVKTLGGQLDSTFNGFAELKIYEATEWTETRGFGGQKTIPITKNPLLLFQIKVPVQNGKIQVETSLPSEIANSYGNSQLILHAVHLDGREAYGDYSRLVIGGASLNNPNTPPAIGIGLPMTNSNKKYGSDVVLKVTLRDEDGILLSNNIIGKETKISIDGNAPTLILELLKTKGVSNREIFFDYPLTDLTTGEHTAEVTAFDVFGNQNTERIVFLVGDGLETYFFPTIFSDDLKFITQRNLVSQTSELNVMVTNQYGQTVITLSRVIQAGEQMNEIIIDKNILNSLDSGIYYFQSTLRSEASGDRFTQTGKLIKQ